MKNTKFVFLLSGLVLGLNAFGAEKSNGLDMFPYRPNEAWVKETGWDEESAAVRASWKEGWKKDGDIAERRAIDLALFNVEAPSDNWCARIVKQLERESVIVTCPSIIRTAVEWFHAEKDKNQKIGLGITLIAMANEKRRRVEEETAALSDNAKIALYYRQAHASAAKLNLNVSTQGQLLPELSAKDEDSLKHLEMLQGIIDRVPSEFRNITVKRFLAINTAATSSATNEAQQDTES